MAITPASISQSSAEIFSILNQAQQTTNDQTEKVAELNIESKLRNDANNFKGQAIDLFV